MEKYKVIQAIVEDLQKDPRLKDTDEFILSKYTRRAVNQVLAHCNRVDLPEEIWDVVEQITESMLQVDGFMKIEKGVSSISRGDMSISYDTSQTALQNVAAFVGNVDCQLMHFKKIRLPKVE